MGVGGEQQDHFTAVQIVYLSDMDLLEPAHGRHSHARSRWMAAEADNVAPTATQLALVDDDKIFFWYCRRVLVSIL